MSDQEKSSFCIVVGSHDETITATSNNPEGLLNCGNGLIHSCSGIMNLVKVTPTKSVLCCSVCFRRIEFCVAGRFSGDKVTTLIELKEYLRFRDSSRRTEKF